MTTETTPQVLPLRTKSSMDSRTINAAAGVLLAAMQQGRQTPTGLALALDSARLLNSPEHAARIAELEARLAPVPTELAEHLGEAKPATTSLVASLAQAVRDVREHEHPKWEDLYCLNLTSYMGERMAPVLRRLLNTEARVAELEARLAEYERPADEDPIAYTLTEQAPLTVYRASHDSIVMGLYTTATAAREHCEAEERRAWARCSAPAFDWIEDEEDGVAELVTLAEDGETETVTGYVVTALEIASAYDAEADE